MNTASSALSTGVHFKLFTETQSAEYYSNSSRIPIAPSVEALLGDIEIDGLTAQSSDADEAASALNQLITFARKPRPTV